MIRKCRHLIGKNKISKFPQVGKMSTDSNICHTSVTVESYTVVMLLTFTHIHNRLTAFGPGQPG